VPEFSGEPCGETSEAQSCNMGSCDKDCVLSEWSVWSDCSKQCDQGSKTRVKTVTDEAVGDGKCKAHDDSSRLEAMGCNEMSCKGNVTCESKLDVVILLDGSGSLGEEGWKQTKKAGEMFVRALHGGENHVKVSVILFSGPTKWAQYEKCTGKVNGTVDMKKDCGIDVVQHFTVDMDAAATVVSGLAWPATTTLTSQALLAAKTELTLGRKDANSVVIVVTDGKPLNSGRTGEAAKQVKAGSRLMWVPVTRNVNIDDIKRWASWPVHENVVEVDDFLTLADPKTIQNVVADMCPKVKQTR